MPFGHENRIHRVSRSQVPDIRVQIAGNTYARHGKRCRGTSSAK